MYLLDFVVKADVLELVVLAKCLVSDEGGKGREMRAVEVKLFEEASWDGVDWAEVRARMERAVRKVEMCIFSSDLFLYLGV